MTDQLNLFDPNASQAVSSEATPPIPAEAAGKLPADLMALAEEQPPDLPPSATAAAPDIPTPADYAARRYLEYAMSVVTGRALPSAADGQKPVQRRSD